VEEETTEKAQAKEKVTEKKHKWLGKGKGKGKATEEADASNEKPPAEKSGPELSKKESGRSGSMLGVGKALSTPHTKSSSAGIKSKGRNGRQAQKGREKGSSKSDHHHHHHGAGVAPGRQPTFGPDDWDQLPGQYEDWNLAKHLEKNRDVLPGPRDKKKRAKCQRLADLLELRAIFVLAFLFMHPDSSDVYLTEGEDVEMPMA
jgi:hypothetical protein